MSHSTIQEGAQRLSIEKLKAWEALHFGMFLHFGMSTFEGCEHPSGNAPASLYTPDQLDVDQWVCVARDAGMKYAVLTAKHVAGHCLWPSKYTDYHVGNSGNTTDVVEAFVTACSKRGVIPGLYYCSWDNHHRLGSFTPTDAATYEKELLSTDGGQHGAVQLSYTTREYREFQMAQMIELMTQYGALGEVWIDIPAVLPRCFRTELYNEIARLQPEAVIMMNTGISDGSYLPVDKAWPSDLIAIERFLPNSQHGHKPWRNIAGQTYYVPGEVCDPIGSEWFFTDDDRPRSDQELLGMYLVTVSRGANLLLDVGPDKHGLIPPKYVEALTRLRKNIDRFA